MSAATKPAKRVQPVLAYLQHRLPAYPFDAKTDQDFVEELVEDFHTVDVLEEVKNFRWFYDGQPVANLRSIRLALRRWIANSRKRKHG